MLSAVLSDVELVASHLQPNATIGQTSGPFTPAAFRQAYGMNLLQFGNVKGDGTGQTIDIVVAYNDPNIKNDLDTFDNSYSISSSGNLLQQYGPASSFFSIQQPQGVPAAPPQPPVNFNHWDLEASLDVEWAHVAAPGAHIVLYEALTDNLLNGVPVDLLNAVSSAQQSAASVVSMSWGTSEFSQETGYDSYFTTPTGHNPITFVAATGDSGSPGAWPAYSPNVLAVGGTNLTVAENGDYASETAWSGSGGGQSTIEAKPSYQINQNSSNFRQIPDVSIDAGSSVYVFDSFGGYGYASVTGTSIGAPVWSGIVAVADQKNVATIGTTLNGATQLLPKLYSGQALPSDAMRDITTGSNGGYAAHTGYDLVTGLGTPEVSFLVNQAWASSSGAFSASGDPSADTFDLVANNGTVTVYKNGSPVDSYSAAAIGVFYLTGTRYADSITLDFSGGNLVAAGGRIVVLSGGGTYSLKLAGNNNYTADTDYGGVYDQGSFSVTDLQGTYDANIVWASLSSITLAGGSGSDVYTLDGWRAPGPALFVNGGGSANTIVWRNGSNFSVSTAGIFSSSPNASASYSNVGRVLIGGQPSTSATVQDAPGGSNYLDAAGATAVMTYPSGTSISLANFGAVTVNNEVANQTDYFTPAASNATFIARTVSNGGSWSKTAAAQFVAASLTTEGNWKGVYGSDGALLVADSAAWSTSAPTPTTVDGYATVSVTAYNSALYLNNYGATNGQQNALLKQSANDGSRVAAIYNTANGIAGAEIVIDINLTDGNTHDVALYLADYDGVSRNNNISVVDAVRGTVLNTIPGLPIPTNGEYLVWNLTGHVQIVIQNNSGSSNALFSGLFFGSISPAAATLVGTDLTTEGNWIGKYGMQGALLAGYSPAWSTSTPSATTVGGYAAVNVTAVNSSLWLNNYGATSGQQNALQEAMAPGGNRVAAIYNTTNGVNGASIVIDVNLTDGKTHQVALYEASYDGVYRDEMIQVTDAATGRVLSNIDGVVVPQNGEYFAWNLTGHVQITVQNVTNSSSACALFSGLFFDSESQVSPSLPEAASVSPLSLDGSTGGQWRNTYGSDGYLIPGDATVLPAYAQLAVKSSGFFSLNEYPADNGAPGALVSPTTGQHFAEIWNTDAGSTLTLDLNLADNKIHQVALYVANFDGTSQAETVSVVDPASEWTIASADVNPVGNGGAYVVLYLTGHVQLKLKSDNGQIAEMSGLFFGSVVTAGSSNTGYDTVTHGQWKGAYGSDGEVIAGDQASVPDYVQMSVASSNNQVWLNTYQANTPGALQSAVPGSSAAVAAIWNSNAGGSLTIDLNFTDGGVHQVALYVANFDSSSQSEYATVLDGTNGGLIVTSNVVAPNSNGQYLVWQLRGHVQIVLHSSAPSSIAEMSGLFFG